MPIVDKISNASHCARPFVAFIIVILSTPGLNLFTDNNCPEVPFWDHGPGAYCRIPSETSEEPVSVSRRPNSLPPADSPCGYGRHGDKSILCIIKTMLEDKDVCVRRLLEGYEFFKNMAQRRNDLEAAKAAA